MRIVDEKGRFFGKINVIDFLVILFLLCILPAFYFGYKIMTKKPVGVAPEKEFIETQIDFQLIKVKPEVAKIVSVGDKELDENGEIVGEIVGLGQSMPYKYELDIGGGQKQKIVIEDAILKQMEAKVKLKTELKQNNLYYKDVLIKVGSPLVFKTNKYSLTAIPFFEEKERIKERQILLKVKFSGVLPEIANIVRKGDVEKDPLGKMAAMITSIISNTPSQTQVLALKENRFITLTYPFSKDLLLVLDVQCIEKEGIFYFKNYPLKMGNNITFATDLYSITGVIIGMSMEEMK